MIMMVNCQVRPGAMIVVIILSRTAITLHIALLLRNRFKCVCVSNVGEVVLLILPSSVGAKGSLNWQL